MKLRSRKSSDRPGFGWRGAVLALLLFTGTVLYITWLPRNLGPADESVHLYEAKRVLLGEVMYRDVFEIITPGWMYLMAFLFRIFGTDMATARIGMAVMHGMAAVLIYLTCLRVGVRRGMGWLAGLAYLLVCQSAWPIASQHWLTTLLSVLLLWVCAGRRFHPTYRAVVSGVVSGLIICVQQQRGIIVAAGVFIWMAVDHVLQSRYRSASAPPPLPARLGFLVAGGLAVGVPLVVGLIASAGFEPVWRALVIHPIFNYGGTTGCDWGHINVMTAAQGSYTFPRFLKYLPAVLMVSALRLAWLWTRRREPEEVRALTLLIIFCLFSMLSIAYFPDFIHIAFIAPAFFVTIAESAEWAVRRVPERAAAVRAAGFVVFGVLLAGCAVRLQRNMVRLRDAYPITRHTAFGRVDFANETEVGLYDTVHEIMEGVPSRGLFCYPVISHFYLMTDAHNPTRYQFFLPGYNSPDQVKELVADLQAARLPYIVVLPSFLRPDDPVMAYIRRDYEPLAKTGKIGQAIFRRKSPAPAGPAAQRY